MRNIVFALSLVLLTPVVLAAQNAPKFEIGTKAGLTFINAEGLDVFVIGIPGAAPFNLSSIAGGTGATVHFGFFPSSNFAVRPELGLGFVNVSPDFGESESLFNLVFSLQGEYHFTGVSMNSAYVAAGVAAQYLDVIDESDEDFAAHAAVGYRLLPFEFLAIAVEARYRRWFDFELNEFGLGFTLAVVAN